MVSPGLDAFGDGGPGGAAGGVFGPRPDDGRQLRGWFGARGAHALGAGVVGGVFDVGEGGADAAPLGGGVLDSRLVGADGSAFVDSSHDAILSTALDGTILSWNAGAERLYGNTAGEMIGTPIARLVPADRPDQAGTILERIARGDVVEHVETAWVRRDATTVPVSLTVSPIRDERGAVVAASTAARDISEQKRLEASLAMARDEAMEASRLKSEFAPSSDRELRGLCYTFLS